MMTCQNCDGLGLIPTCKDKCMGEGCKNEHNCSDCPEFQNFEECGECDGDGEVSLDAFRDMQKANRYDERRADR